MNISPDYNVNGDLNYLLNPLSNIEIRDENINQLKNRLKDIKTGEGITLWDELSSNINIIQEILKKADFDFGFRTINEIVRFMYVAWEYDKNIENPLYGTTGNDISMLKSCKKCYQNSMVHKKSLLMF